jgi:hypothetical protein
VSRDSLRSTLKIRRGSKFFDEVMTFQRRPPSRLVRAGLRTGSYQFQTEPVRRIARRLEPVLRIRPPIASRLRAIARAARTRDARPMSTDTMYLLDCDGARSSATHTKCILLLVARVYI